jgi:hypothetical protein
MIEASGAIPQPPPPHENAEIIGRPTLYQQTTESVHNKAFITSAV